MLKLNQVLVAQNCFLENHCIGLSQRISKADHRLDLNLTFKKIGRNRNLLFLVTIY